MPIPESLRPSTTSELTASGLLAALSFVERKFDQAALPPTDGRPPQLEEQRR
jgi:hypothetical protein